MRQQLELENKISEFWDLLKGTKQEDSENSFKVNQLKEFNSKYYK